MKNSFVVSKLACSALLCGGLILGCGKDDPAGEDPAPPVERTDPGPNDPVPVDPVGPPAVDGTIIADTISDHLRFFRATKVQGAIPKGPSGSSLKVSFEDTLYLVDELSAPIKFLHEDPSENVAGVYLQVLIGGTGGTFYYDVPELPEMAENDTVSLVMIGVDPKGLFDSGVPPAGSPPFQLTIVPYDENGGTIDETVRPGKVYDPNAKGTCSIVTEPDEYWYWNFPL